MGKRGLREVIIAGPFTVERQVVAGSRAGCESAVHAAVGLVLEATLLAETRRAELSSHQPRPNRAVFAGRRAGQGYPVRELRRLGPLRVAVAPLEARARVVGRRRCRSGQPRRPLRELVAYLSSVGRVSW